MKKWLIIVLIIIGILVFTSPIWVMFGSGMLNSIYSQNYKNLEEKNAGTTYETLEADVFYWCSIDYYNSFTFPGGVKIKLVGIKAQQNTPGGFIPEATPDAHYAYELQGYEAGLTCNGPNFRSNKVKEISEEEYKINEPFDLSSFCGKINGTYGELHRGKCYLKAAHETSNYSLCGEDGYTCRYDILVEKGFCNDITGGPYLDFEDHCRFKIFLMIGRLDNCFAVEECSINYAVFNKNSSICEDIGADSYRASCIDAVENGNYVQMQWTGSYYGFVEVDFFPAYLTGLSENGANWQS